MSVFKVGEPEKGIHAIGPFEAHKIVIDGYQVPNLTGRVVNGMWHFTLSNSCSVDVPEMYGLGVAWMIANAMAIGNGYTCFGAGSKPFNPYRSRLIRLAAAAEIDTMEAQGGES